MRVVVNEDLKVFHGHVAVRLAAGQEVSGELAAMLLERAPRKVSRVDAEEVETGGDQKEDVPVSLADASTGPQVLAWVGEDPARAREALEAEQEAEKPRSTLVKQLQKLAEA